MSTIYALSTPFAKSAIAVIRISGSSALGALEIFGCHAGISPRMATYVRLTYNHEIIDNAVAIYFKAPASFTGEDVVELQLHGGRAIIQQVLHILSTVDDFRPAEAGEFSRRAFINGKMDLIEAEAIQDLINAETVQQKNLAMRQANGVISQIYESIRARIVKCLAYLEAYIDFPDEDLPESLAAEIENSIEELKQELHNFLHDGRAGEIIHNGVRVAIIGAPNVGKSSILNALAKRDAAITSEHAGTTRDVIEVKLDIAGLPFIIYDTAGIRETNDPVETEGIRRALGVAENADLILEIQGAQSEGYISPIHNTGSSIRIINKVDILSDSEIQGIRKKYLEDNITPHFISAKTGQGMDELLNSLEEFAGSILNSAENSIITSARHRWHLQKALALLGDFTLKKPIELSCEDVRGSASEIGRITGRIGVEELLDEIFRNFCIGK